MKLEVLHVPDCPNLSPMLERLAAVTNLPVTTRVIDNDAEAVQFGMAGSPTLLINGVDPFTMPGQGECGVSCRLYRDEGGRVVSAPSVKQLREAITAAGEHQPSTPGEVLSAWRTRALPLDPVERAAHQAILRAFAATGRPAADFDLDPVTAGSGRSQTEVLNALHEVDAIRLAPDGQIAVAYPFSATPTRHRVRIGDQVDVYAMCAIDALGIAPMLCHDTLIESADVTTGQPITVTTIGGHTSWEPAGAVVFIGADATGGPSADCCCDYLNFFTDRDAAEAWTSAHPHVPGTILDQTDAQDLGARLFGHLLNATDTRP
ncbi:alkylmercury lyase family protein [Kribbella sp. NBC_01245]|uniref:alkylmercury lyase family protein n=1 Tax=Kribbella sp. NBC_01245 TaxID=2903578 RepID=UPI002E2AE6F4|nr:alkylmercury lyase family protein [Kribbella sp. NBC_01245]